MQTSNLIQEPSKMGNLLIVEDEPDIREILSELLEPHAAQIQTANNGREALDLIKKGGIHAIMSDINMPIMNGFLLLTEVRTMSLLTPFVIVTAFGDKQNLLEAVRLNATDFLEKPFKTEEVIRVMKQALEFGIKLEELEKDLDQTFDSLPLPADEILKKKQLKRVIFGMKYGRMKS